MPRPSVLFAGCSESIDGYLKWLNYRDKDESLEMKLLREFISLTSDRSGTYLYASAPGISLNCATQKALYQNFINSKLYCVYGTENFHKSNMAVIAALLDQGHCPQGLRMDFSSKIIDEAHAGYLLEALQSPRCPKGLQIKLPKSLDAALLKQIDDHLYPDDIMKEFNRLRNYENALLEEILRCKLDRDKNSGACPDMEFSELVSDLAYRTPEAKSLCGMLMGFDKQFRLAKEALETTLVRLDVTDPRLTAAIDLQKKLEQTKEKYPADIHLLTQVLWQTKRMIDDPSDETKMRYSQLAQEVSHRSWGKLIAGAMLALTFATLLVVCCATGFGVISLPFMTLGLNALIPVAIGSGIVSLVGVGLFAKGVKAQPRVQMDKLLIATEMTLPRVLF